MLLYKKARIIESRYSITKKMTDHDISGLSRETSEKYSLYMEKLKEGIDLNSRQLDAFYSALKGRNIFITGPAGEQSLNIDVFFHI